MVYNRLFFGDANVTATTIHPGKNIFFQKKDLEASWGFVGWAPHVKQTG